MHFKSNRLPTHMINHLSVLLLVQYQTKSLGLQYNYIIAPNLHDENTKANVYCECRNISINKCTYSVKRIQHKKFKKQRISQIDMSPARTSPRAAGASEESVQDPASGPWSLAASLPPGRGFGGGCRCRAEFRPPCILRPPFAGTRIRLLSTPHTFV